MVGRVRTLVFYIWPEEMDEETAPPPKKLLNTYWTMYEYENLTSKAEAEDKDIDKVLCFICFFTSLIILILRVCLTLVLHRFGLIPADG